MLDYFNVVVHIVSCLDSTHYAEPFSLAEQLALMPPTSSWREAPLTSSSTAAPPSCFFPCCWWTTQDGVGDSFRSRSQATLGPCTLAAVFGARAPWMGSEIPDPMSIACTCASWWPGYCSIDRGLAWPSIPKIPWFGGRTSDCDDPCRRSDVSGMALRSVCVRVVKARRCGGVVSTSRVGSTRCLQFGGALQVLGLELRDENSRSDLH